MGLCGTKPMVEPASKADQPEQQPHKTEPSSQIDATTCKDGLSSTTPSEPCSKLEVEPTATPEPCSAPQPTPPSAPADSKAQTASETVVCSTQPVSNNSSGPRETEEIIVKETITVTYQKKPKSKPEDSVSDETKTDNPDPATDPKPSESPLPSETKTTESSNTKPQTESDTSQSGVVSAPAASSSSEPTATTPEQSPLKRTASQTAKDTAPPQPSESAVRSEPSSSKDDCATAPSANAEEETEADPEPEPTNVTHTEPTELIVSATTIDPEPKSEPKKSKDKPSVNLPKPSPSSSSLAAARLSSLDSLPDSVTDSIPETPRSGKPALKKQASATSKQFESVIVRKRSQQRFSQPPSPRTSAPPSAASTLVKKPSRSNLAHPGSMGAKSGQDKSKPYRLKNAGRASVLSALLTGEDVDDLQGSLKKKRMESDPTRRFQKKTVAPREMVCQCTSRILCPMHRREQRQAALEAEAERRKMQPKKQLPGYMLPVKPRTRAGEHGPAYQTRDSRTSTPMSRSSSRSSIHTQV